MATAGDLNIMQMLLDATCKIDSLTWQDILNIPDDDDAQTPLHCATEAGNTALLLSLRTRCMWKS